MSSTHRILLPGFLIIASAVFDRAQAAPRELAPCLASNGADFLLSWADNSGDAPVVMSEPLSPTGASSGPSTVLGPTVHPAATIFPPVTTPEPISCAFGATTYLVAWNDGEHIAARRLSATGVPLDRAPLIVGRTRPLDPYWSATSALSDQAIAWNSWGFVVVWNGTEGVTAAFVNENGFVSPPIVLRVPGESPRVIWDGRRFILTFVMQHYYPGPVHGYLQDAIGVVRFDAAGFLLDRTDSVEVVQIEAMNRWRGLDPQWHLATNGVETVVVVSGPRFWGSYDGNTRAIAIRAEGLHVTLGEPQILFPWFSDSISNVAWDGERFVAVIRYGVLPFGPFQNATWWLAAARFLPDEEPTFTVTDTGKPDVFESPSIAAPIAGTPVVAFSEEDAEMKTTIRAVIEDSLDPLPPLPSSPVAVSATASGQTTLVRWQFDAPYVGGFVIEEVYPDVDYAETIGIVNGDARSLAVTRIPRFVRVRAFNAAGLSEPSASTAVMPGRRRSASH